MCKFLKHSVPVSMKTTKLDGGKSSNVFGKSSGVVSCKAGDTYWKKTKFGRNVFYLTNELGGSVFKLFLK